MEMVGTDRPVVLMVDEDERLLAAVCRSLSGSFDLVTHMTGETALDWLRQNAARAHLIIADLVMPTADGVGFLKHAAHMAPTVPRILLSGMTSSISMREVVNQIMVTRVLAKPISVSVLKEAIDRVLLAGKPATGPSIQSLSPVAVNAALDRGDLRTVLQPRFRTSDFGFCGAEIMCSLPSLEQEFGIDDIFNACHGHPVINRLTRQLMTAMVDQAACYGRLMGENAKISVNLSTYSLRSESFVDQIIRFYEKMRMRGVSISFEIPEHQIAATGSELVSTALRLRERGIALMIDDFGSGSNSLGLLRHDLFAGIRLDRDLVRGVMTDVLDDAFVEWIARTCSKLGLSLSAKGIECPGLVEKLRVYGITEVQDACLAGPAPVEAWEVVGQMTKVIYG